MLIQSLLVFLAASSVSSAPVYQARHSSQKRLVVFGDSFSDDGHGAWVVSNHTWPPASTYIYRRFSNGPVWPQYVAGDLDLKLLDYATGGATANNSVVQGYTGRMSDIEVPASLDQIQSFTKKYDVSSKDVYAVFIGANDFFFDANITGQTVANLVERQITQLYKLGGRKFLLFTYPNLGKIPAAAISTSAANVILSQQTLDLNEQVLKLSKKWSSRINIQVVDIYKLVQAIIANPEEYGIDPAYLQVACLKGTYPSEGVETSVCDDPEKHIYWDIYHPTTTIHRLVADAATKAIKKL